jgi:hypothetical protein
VRWASHCYVRLIPLAVAAIWLSAPAFAQQARPSALSPGSPSDIVQSTSQDARDLNRIREALAKPAPPLVLHVVVPADFKSEVTEQRKFDDLLKSLDFRGGPTPPGGVYAYEQQRVVLNPTNYPLMQPYAAFSASELLTLAAEGVAVRYAGGTVLKDRIKAEHARVLAAARAEVLRTIADFCAAQHDAAAIPICQTAPERAQ